MRAGGHNLSREQGRYLGPEVEAGPSCKSFLLKSRHGIHNLLADGQKLLGDGVLDAKWLRAEAEERVLLREPAQSNYKYVLNRA